MRTQNINISSLERDYFCQHYYINKLPLFGSVLQENFRPESNIDVSRVSTWAYPRIPQTELDLGRTFKSFEKAANRSGDSEIAQP